MLTQSYMTQPLFHLQPENPLFDPDEVAAFCDTYRDPVQYPKLEKIGHRWDHAVVLACTPGAVVCKDPEERIFLVKTESGQDFFYRVDLKVKLPGIACTCPDDRRNPDIPCKHRIAAVLYRHFIELKIGLQPEDTCRATEGRLQCFATVLDVFANWVKVDVDQTSGFDNHRITPFWDLNGAQIFIKWLEYGENCFRL